MRSLKAILKFGDDPEEDDEPRYKTVRKEHTATVIDTEYTITFRNGDTKTHEGTNIRELERQEAATKLVVEERTGATGGGLLTPTLEELKYSSHINVIAWYYLHDVRTYDETKLGEHEISWEEPERVPVEESDD